MTRTQCSPRVVLLPDDASGRLDSLLSRLLSGVSRRRLKAAFREGRVRMEGRRVRGQEEARPRATVEIVDLPGWGDVSAAGVDPEPAAIEIVHADEDLVVVEKPPGAPSYPLYPGEGGSVAEVVLRLFPDMDGVGDLPNAPGLCHRLDVETSGLLLFARNSRAFESLRRQFRARSVEKTYLAAVVGRLRGEGRIDVPLGRRSARRMVADPPGSMRRWPARTVWEALSLGDAATLVRASLETGVTHQARVHMAWLGHPIIGDDGYGGPPADRLYLHASALRVEHPGTGEPVEIESNRNEAVALVVRRWGGD